MTNYRGEKIVIIGLGVTGLSCVDFFRTRGVIPRIIDTRLIPPGLEKLPADVPRHLGSLNEKWLLDATLVVASPGIPLLHSVLADMTTIGIRIIGDIELFAREVSMPVIAITGSNGKSTVTRMVSEMASAASYTVGIGGNIGQPALALLKSPYQLYILELSSFQLKTTYSLKATAATVLNISADHMNSYPLGLQEYRKTKLAIYHNATRCLFNADDPLTFPIDSHDNRHISFGVKCGDYSLNQRSRKTWLMAHNKLLLDCAEMTISGRHNYINALAAIALVDTIGIPHTASLPALRKFQGLAHRFQLVHERYGVRWINDSKATNVGSTEAALKSLEVKGTLHLLLGGDGKSADFTPLTPWLQGDRIQLYCFGKDRAQLASLRPNAATITETLEQAMCIISSRVKEKDLVLLSPACASIDQFSNFEMRGEIFKRLAQELG
ncbi:MAG: UDP-N-acetylmuramoyl-L-alanine--D-glutamate ligase [Sodalis sp. (in: enterobacteria)]